MQLVHVCCQVLVLCCVYSRATAEVVVCMYDPTDACVIRQLCIFSHCMYYVKCTVCFCCSSKVLAVLPCCARMRSSILQVHGLGASVSHKWYCYSHLVKSISSGQHNISQQPDAAWSAYQGKKGHLRLLPRLSVERVYLGQT